MTCGLSKVDRDAIAMTDGVCTNSGTLRPRDTNVMAGSYMWCRVRTFAANRPTREVGRRGAPPGPSDHHRSVNNHIPFTARSRSGDRAKNATGAFVGRIVFVDGVASGRAGVDAGGDGAGADAGV